MKKQLAKGIFISLLGLAVLATPVQASNQRLIDGMTYKSSRIVIQALEAGANPNLKIDGTPALVFAAQYRMAPAVARLLALGAQVDAVSDVDGASALHAAIQQGDTDIVEMLLAAGADYELKSQQTEKTPLILAVYYGHYQIAQSLLDKGARVDATSQNGATPLLVAAYRNQPAIAKLLLQRGADPNARAQDGKSLLELAQAHDFNRVTLTVLNYRSGQYDVDQILAETATQVLQAQETPPPPGQMYNFAQQIQQMNALLQDNPKNNLAWLTRGYLHYLQHDYTACIQDETQALKYHLPKRFQHEAYGIRGHCFLGQDEAQLGLENIEKALYIYDATLQQRVFSKTPLRPGFYRQSAVGFMSHQALLIGKGQALVKTNKPQKSSYIQLQLCSQAPVNSPACSGDWPGEAASLEKRIAYYGKKLQMSRARLKTLKTMDKQADFQRYRRDFHEGYIKRYQALIARYRQEKGEAALEKLLKSYGYWQMAVY